MRFPEASSGIKKVYLAEIFALIAVFCTLLAAAGALTAIGTAAVDAADAETLGSSDVALAVGAGAVMLIAGVLGILSIIFNLIGLRAASHDDKFFKWAFIAAIVSLALAVIGGMSPSDSIEYMVFDIANDVATALITVFVINGVVSLAGQLGNQDMAESGSRLLRLIIAMYVLIIAASVISYILTSVSSNNMITAIFAFIPAVLSAILFIVYLIYLNKAKAMLAQ